MADKSLAGKKIAVLVESQYVSAEIKCYQERFAGYGAEVALDVAALGTAEADVRQRGRGGRQDAGNAGGRHRLHAGEAGRLRRGDHGRELHERAAALERSGGDQLAMPRRWRAPRRPSTSSAGRCKTGGSSRARPATAVAADALARLPRRAAGHLQSGGAGRRAQRRRVLRSGAGRQRLARARRGRRRSGHQHVGTWRPVRNRRHRSAGRRHPRRHPQSAAGKRAGPSPPARRRSRPASAAC